MKIDLEKYKNSQKTVEEQSKSEPFWKRDISFSKKRLNDKLKERFYNDFLTLIKAGIDVQKTLNILSSDKKNKKYISVIQHIEKELIQGKTLSDSMKSSAEFSDYEINSIKIGEETGNFTLILEQLNQFFYGKIKLRKLLIKAISYPIFILVVAVGVIFFMLQYVVPMFENVFSQFDQELPELTQKILLLSELLQKYFLYIVVLLIVIISWVYSQRKKLWFRKISTNIVIRIPFFGGLIKQIYLARFYQFMYLLTNAKHNLVKSVGLVKNVIGFYPIEMALDKTENDLRKGEFLNTSLKKSGFFDTRLITLVEVAENSNQLDRMFEKLSIQEQESLEIKTQMMGSILEPLFIILVGVIVVAVLVAMYLPLFNLSNIL